MIRFLQQFESGKGDYARERHTWVDQTSLEQRVAPIKPKQSERK